MEKVAIGIPSYGGQTAYWWKPLAQEMSRLYKDDIDLVDVIHTGGMLTDYNRNDIARRFLKSEAEWLYWIDDDNPPVIGAIRRLLNTHKRIVSGLYIKGTGDPTPICYYRNPDGTYTYVEDLIPGEIREVDAIGMGCCLTHRSVFEDLLANYTPVLRSSGGVTPILTEMIEGELQEHVEGDIPEHKIVDGVWQEPVYKTDFPLPFFVLEHGRTEDIVFGEMCQRIGIPMYVDSSIMVAHVKSKPRSPQEYYEWMRNQKS